MTKTELADFIADFIMSTPELIVNAIIDDDSDAIRDEAFEYLNNCDYD